MTMHFLIDVNDVELMSKVRNVSLKSKLNVKLINRITGPLFVVFWHLLLIQQAISKPCLVKLLSYNIHLVVSINTERKVNLPWMQTNMHNFSNVCACWNYHSIYMTGVVAFLRWE